MAGNHRQHDHRTRGRQHWQAEQPQNPGASNTMAGNHRQHDHRTRGRQHWQAEQHRRGGAERESEQAARIVAIVTKKDLRGVRHVGKWVLSLLRKPTIEAGDSHEPGDTDDLSRKVRLPLGASHGVSPARYLSNGTI